MLYTIGHSNHSIGNFINLLRQHNITTIADVRSEPYSRYHSQFNKDILEIDLRTANISYVFLGKELGARPKDISCYENGKVSFEKLAEKTEFRQAIENLVTLSNNNTVAIVCAEKEPLNCHRTILIAKELTKHNVCIQHILADGSTENHLDTEKRLIRKLDIEPTLFESGKSMSEIVDSAYKEQSKKVSFQLEQQV